MDLFWKHTKCRILTSTTPNVKDWKMSQNQSKVFSFHCFDTIFQKTSMLCLCQRNYNMYCFYLKGVNRKPSQSTRRIPHYTQDIQATLSCVGKFEYLNYIQSRKSFTLLSLTLSTLHTAFIVQSKIMNEEVHCTRLCVKILKLLIMVFANIKQSNIIFLTSGLKSVVVIVQISLILFFNINIYDLSGFGCKQRIHKDDKTIWRQTAGNSMWILLAYLYCVCDSDRTL